VFRILRACDFAERQLETQTAKVRFPSPLRSIPVRSSHQIVQALWAKNAVLREQEVAQWTWRQIRMSDPTDSFSLYKAIQFFLRLCLTIPTHHTTNDANPEYVEPAVHKIEQVRACKGRDRVLDHHDSTNPSR
jgi:hypothetical protein